MTFDYTLAGGDRDGTDVVVEVDVKRLSDEDRKLMGHSAEFTVVSVDSSEGDILPELEPDCLQTLLVRATQLWNHDNGIL